MSDETAIVDDLPNRKRSPVYPSFPIQSAIEKAATIYSKIKRNTVTNADAAHALGLSGKSGTGLTTLSTLKRYGLLAEDGTGQVRLSALGLSIILNETESSPERIQAIRTAVLKPEVFGRLYQKFGADLPDNSIMKTHLIMKEGFSPESASTCIESFRESLSAVAQVESSNQQSTTKSEPISTGTATPQTTTPPPVQTPIVEQSPAAPQTGSRTLEFKIPLEDGSSVVLHYPSKMTANDYDMVEMFLEQFWKKKKTSLVAGESLLQ